jgi:hypothetical protein
MKGKLLLFVILFTSCRVTDKQVRNYPALARVCADKYPVRTTYLPGKDSVRYLPVNVSVPGGMVGLFLPGTNAKQTDTVHSGNLVLSYQQIPTGYQVYCRADSLLLLLDSLHEIHHRTDTMLLENTAHVTALQHDSTRLVVQNALLQTELQKVIKQARSRLIWAIGLAAILGVGLFLKIKK